MDTGILATTFSNPRVMRSMLGLAIGLGLALCVIIVLFQGTWFLPALVAAVALGMVAGYLYWLDGQDFRREEGFVVPEDTRPGPAGDTAGNRRGGEGGSAAGKAGSAAGPATSPGTYTILPGREPLTVDTGDLYATFTRPKVVTSMLLIGIGLGVALSVLISRFRGQWYMPVGFAALAMATVFVYMAWLDRQDLREE